MQHYCSVVRCTKVGIARISGLPVERDVLAQHDEQQDPDVPSPVMATATASTSAANLSADE
jgi:hypothetical protein